METATNNAKEQNMKWVSYMVNGYTVDMKLPVGSMYRTQWGNRKVLDCRLEKIVPSVHTEPSGV